MYAFQGKLKHLQLQLDNSGPIVEVADLTQHFLVHRHQNRSGEGALMCILHGDGLASLFVVVGYLKADVEDLDDGFVAIEGDRRLDLMVDGLEEDPKELHRR